MGIPVDLLPFRSDDTVQTENHHKWLQFRIRQEQKQQEQEQQEQQQQQSGPSPMGADSDMMDDGGDDH